MAGRKEQLTKKSNIDWPKLKLTNPTLMKLTQQSKNAQRYIPSNDIANLTFWIEHASYTYCDKCKTILPVRLLPKFSKRPAIKEGSKTCPCKTTRYMEPKVIYQRFYVV